MHYRLRTLLIVLASGPPVLAWGWSLWREAQRELMRPETRHALQAIADVP